MIITNLAYLFASSFESVLIQLGIDDNKRLSLGCILAYHQQKEDDELFIEQLKVWMKVCDDDYIIETDY